MTRRSCDCHGHRGVSLVSFPALRYHQHLSLFPFLHLLEPHLHFTRSLASNNYQFLSFNCLESRRARALSTCKPESMSEGRRDDRSSSPMLMNGGNGAAQLNLPPSPPLPPSSRRSSPNPGQPTTSRPQLQLDSSNLYDTRLSTPWTPIAGPSGSEARTASSSSAPAPVLDLSSLPLSP